MTPYEPPTPEEVRALLAQLNLTGGEAAALMGLSDGRSVRKYTGGQAPREMSFAGLYTLVHRKAGVTISPENWRQELIQAAISRG